ncbi:F0F1 ATP synthase subunit delta [Risungbinella massiliensis]|uniref:F0F1 ATP synthase subunit delta n=1 Tax=Risungbinella massiliensis TaxID=1329796 RepID=UPI0005CBD859|nr:F0F1 ATP synthase subunit delta [Risungbinella massiliensis]
MSAAVVDKRYAKALFEIASDKNLLEQTEQELVLVEKVMKETPALVAWLTHPSTQLEQQKEMIAKSFGSLSSHVKNLLFLLVDRKRLLHLSGILASYRNFANDALGLAKAVVTSAFPLLDVEKESIARTFEPIIGKKLVLEEKVDSDLLGGAVVQIGDRLYDGSLRTKLQRFRENLSAV